MRVTVTSSGVDGITRTEYSCRSFSVYRLSGSEIRPRVSWATTAGVSAFIELCRDRATGEATVTTDDKSDSMPLGDVADTEPRRVSVPVSEGRLVWMDKTDDRWLSHERPPYTVMVVGRAEPPLVPLRPRNVTKKTAAAVAAELSEWEE